MNSNVTVQNVTILAPFGSPNTDGIDPGELGSIYSYVLQCIHSNILVEINISLSIVDR